jgi:hypothetical protein
LRVRGRPEQQAAVTDISRGGVSLRSGWQAEGGTEVELTLPGVAESVGARVVCAAGGSLALAFRENEAMVKRVDRALGHIARNLSRGSGRGMPPGA